MPGPKENFSRRLAQIGRANGGTSLADRLVRIGERVEKAAQDAQRRVALAIDQAVVLGTPVDTGRARSNWRVSINQPVPEEIPPYVPGSKLGLGETANASAAIEQGLTVLASHRGAGGAIWISNNVHYIGMLENGHSPQNRGFVKAAVLQGKVLLKRFTLLNLQRSFGSGN